MMDSIDKLYFSQRWKSKIENGMTRHDFVALAKNEEELQEFDRLVDQVQLEDKMGEEFINAFTSIPIK